MNIKEKMITSLRNELEAARRRLQKETSTTKRAEITGYIRALQVAMVVVNRTGA